MNANTSMENERLTIEEAILFNAKDEPTPGAVKCLVCGMDLQYLTHSHMAAHAAESPRSVEDYKSKVAETLEIDEDEVPIVSADLSERLAERTREGWTGGRYDHFRL